MWCISLRLIFCFVVSCVSCLLRVFIVMDRLLEDELVMLEMILVDMVEIMSVLFVMVSMLFLMMVKMVSVVMMVLQFILDVVVKYGRMVFFVFLDSFLSEVFMCEGNIVMMIMMVSVRVMVGDQMLSSVVREVLLYFFWVRQLVVQDLEKKQIIVKFIMMIMRMGSRFNMFWILMDGFLIFSGVWVVR